MSKVNFNFLFEFDIYYCMITGDINNTNVVS